MLLAELVRHHGCYPTRARAPDVLPHPVTDEQGSRPRSRGLAQRFLVDGRVGLAHSHLGGIDRGVEEVEEVEEMELVAHRLGRVGCVADDRKPNPLALQRLQDGAGMGAGQDAVEPGSLLLLHHPLQGARGACDADLVERIPIQLGDVDLLFRSLVVGVPDLLVDPLRHRHQELSRVWDMALQLFLQAHVYLAVRLEQMGFGALQVNQGVAVIEEDDIERGRHQSSPRMVSRFRRPSMCSSPGVSRMKGNPRSCGWLRR